MVNHFGLSSSKKAWFVGIGLSLLIACQKNSFPEPHVMVEEAWELGVFRAHIIEVVDRDTGEPLPRAEVLVGEEVNKPFVGNFGFTDQRGVRLVPLDWRQPLPVSVRKDGYIPVTHWDLDPADAPHRIRLKKEPNLAQTFELLGQVTGFQVRNSDGWIDFSVTLPLIPKDRLFEFQLSEFLSPYTDQISVLGQTISVPANVSFPDQRETYILPFRLNKPTYRIGFFEPGHYSLVTLNGVFPVRPVFDAMRGGASFAEVINHFRMDGLSFDGVQISQPRSQMNIRIAQNPLNQMALVRLRGSSAGQVLLAVSVGERPEGFFPVDVRRVNEGQDARVKISPQHQHRVLGLVRDEKDFMSGSKTESLSAALVSLQAPRTTEIQVMPLLGALTRVSQSGEVQRPNYSLPVGFRDAGSLWKLYRLDQRRLPSGDQVEVKVPAWEIYTKDWVTAVRIPRFPSWSEPSGPKRWTVSLFAATTRVSWWMDVSSLDLNQVTHVTHQSLDY